MNRYIADAIYTNNSLVDDINSKIDAHSYISDDDWESYYRAQKLVKQQECLWEDYDGLLTDKDHVYNR